MSFLSRSCFPRICASLVLCGGILLSVSLGSGLGAASEREANTSDAAVKMLLRTPTGRRMLEAARVFWGEAEVAGVVRHLAYGPVSRTDAVLTRHYKPETGEESRVRTVTVLLRRDQPLEEMALDLAHELTHAIAPPSWDPYDPKLTAGKYIHASLEAHGGEIEAVTTECQASVELTEVYGLHFDRCNRYIERKAGEDGEVAVVRADRIKQDFYRVGSYRSAIDRTLGEEKGLFPELSSKRPELYSATGQAPYPWALIQEYQELTRTACANVKRRSLASAGSAPAGHSLGNRCGGADG